MKKKILLVITAQNSSKHIYERLGVGLNYKNVIIGETVWFVSVHLGRTKK